MLEHLIAPGLASRPSNLRPEHREWLKSWLEEVGEGVEREELAASTCVAALVAEDWLYSKPRTDWLALMTDLLEDEGGPLAYSENFGRKLYKFNDWRQTTVHAVYSRWWIEGSLGKSYSRAAELIESFVQPSGLVYNPEVSDTGERTRMRSELLMSLAMGVEVLTRSGKLAKIAETTAASTTLPVTRYVSAEYFRLKALELAGKPELMVGDALSTVRRCRAEPGFADYCVDDKVDEYMGSHRRVERDKSVFSPLSTLQALYLAERTKGVNLSEVKAWREKVAIHLAREPLGIPALRMRDLEPPFGEGITAYEVLAAARLLS